MSSSNLTQLGNGHIVSGIITASAATDAALTSNDPTATLTRNGAGDYTVTFGKVFNASPYVFAQLVRATFATNMAQADIEVYSRATNAVKFNISQTALAGTVSALADTGDIQFVAIGARNI